jgi:hypothetical protein
MYQVLISFHIINNLGAFQFVSFVSSQFKSKIIGAISLVGEQQALTT